jgi:hypothetical protein
VTYKTVKSITTCGHLFHILKDNEFGQISPLRKLLPQKGYLLTPENICSIRPGYGLHPKHINEVIGHRATFEIAKGTPVTWKLVEDQNRTCKTLETKDLYNLRYNLINFQYE